MRGLFILAAIGLTLSGQSTAFGEVKLELKTDHPRLVELAKRLPVLDTDHSACPSFDAEVRINLDEGGYQLDFRFLRPGRIQFLARDLRDGSPCVLYRDARMAVFDPVGPQFIVADDYKLMFSVVPLEGDRIHAGINAGFGKEHQRRLQFDLAGIMQLPGTLVDLGSGDDCVHLELRRPSGGREVTKLTVNDQHVVCVHESWTKGEAEPSMIQKFIVHATNNELLFKDLAVHEVKEVLPVRTALREETGEATGKSVPEQMMTFALIMRGGFAHVALWHPSAREDFKIPLVPEPDWESIAKVKRELGPRLRDLYGLPERSTNREDAPLAPTFAAEEAQTVK
jgi:hypothetical protein